MRESENSGRGRVRCAYESPLLRAVRFESRVLLDFSAGIGGFEGGGSPNAWDDVGFTGGAGIGGFEGGGSPNAWDDVGFTGGAGIGSFTGGGSNAWDEPVTTFSADAGAGLQGFDGGRAEYEWD